MVYNVHVFYKHMKIGNQAEICLNANSG